MFDFRLILLLKKYNPETNVDISCRWIQKWTELVPTLMFMKSDRDNDEKENDSELNTDGECLAAPNHLNNERGEDYQEQIGMPDEENMRSWSHHHKTDTVDDPIFRAAMRGYDQVSFVFGLEVTWSLIQQRQQDEEERQAMLELESMKEMYEAFDIDTVKEQEDGDDKVENDDDVIATKKSSAAKKSKKAPTEKKTKACADKKSKARVLDSDEDSDEDDDMKDFIVKEEDEDDGDDDMEHEDVAKEEDNDSSNDEDEDDNSEGDVKVEESPCVEDVTDVMMAKKSELTQKMIDDAEEIIDDEDENKEEESETIEITDHAASVAANAPIAAIPAETNEVTQSGAWTCEVSQSVFSVFAFDDKAYCCSPQSSLLH